MSYRYLTSTQLLEIHFITMERFGEKEQAGILFNERFHSAIARPQMFVFGHEIHATLWEKAGALVQSLVQEHPFQNGNKRTALAAVGMFLYLNGHRLICSDDEAMDLLVAIATEKMFRKDEAPLIIGEMIQSFSKVITDESEQERSTS